MVLYNWKENTFANTFTQPRLLCLQSLDPISSLNEPRPINAFDRALKELR